MRGVRVPSTSATKYGHRERIHSFWKRVFPLFRFSLFLFFFHELRSLSCQPYLCMCRMRLLAQNDTP
jgi:hypothetical protein